MYFFGHSLKHLTHTIATWFASSVQNFKNTTCERPSHDTSEWCEAWHSPLAASHCEDTVQDCCFDLRLCPWSCLRLPHGKSSAQSRICHVGHSVRLTAVTCSFRGQTRPSASEVSPSRLLSSGTHFHLTSAHRTSRQQFRSKLKTHLFRQAYNTARFLWEQFVEECDSVTVTVTDVTRRKLTVSKRETEILLAYFKLRIHYWPWPARVMFGPWGWGRPPGPPVHGSASDKYI